ncbi:c2h2 finger domain containing protein [Niveomyces insectorum RCEF 264]|uniref:C2h2 finger domain containing protein n=1 Tax=Niveomyces insectorum RCEF 264 TaxID=1081102 RepID=A0A167PSH5_9HYPO|nr:c2h2 finger domain containing protein [Niveomyces insectorum RCEF 264]
MRGVSEDLDSLYPEPPQAVFPSPPLSINQHLSPDNFFPRAQTECFAPNSMAFNNASILLPDTPFTGIFADYLSSTLYQEDAEMQVLSSSLSTVSGPSAPSSAIGSPRSHHDMSSTVPEWPAPQCASVSPNILSQGDFLAPGDYGYSNNHLDEFTHFEFPPPPKSFVAADPSVLHSEVRTMGIPSFDTYSQPPPPPAPQPQPNHQTAYTASPEHSPQLRAGSVSPYQADASAYPQFNSPYLAPTPMGDQASRASRSSFSGYSPAEQQFSDGEGKEKQRCTYPNCGRRFKDLRAHMLTHQNERPEKCPIQTCEYHTKGFARKYDKNRHTLTHYKGTMVCGFCPGSGSPAEKSFNRADVFKRHLTAVHGVEQTPPNSRKKVVTGNGVNGVQKLTTYAPDATGKCSTCSQTFSNAQEFYEHLDDCVLRIVQLEDPAEAVNASRLAEVEDDEELKATLEKNQVLLSTPAPADPGSTNLDDDDEENMEDEDCGGDDETANDGSGSGSGSSSSTAKGTSASPKKAAKGNPAHGVQKSRGMTHSRGGVPFAGKPRSRRNRQNYPTSWGFDKGQMTMRKRVMTVFEGPRRLAKDDMMLSTEHEVRLKLSDGRSYVTDLDVQTLKRAEGFLNATEEEKGPWISDDPTDEQLRKMQLSI